MAQNLRTNYLEDLHFKKLWAFEVQKFDLFFYAILDAISLKAVFPLIKWSTISEKKTWIQNHHTSTVCSNLSTRFSHYTFLLHFDLDSRSTTKIIHLRDNSNSATLKKYIWTVFSYIWEKLVFSNFNLIWLWASGSRQFLCKKNVVKAKFSNIVNFWGSQSYLIGIG